MPANRRQPLSNAEFMDFWKEYKPRVGADYIRTLREDRVILLDTTRSRSRKFRNAFFYCEVCNYHIHSEEEMEEHREIKAHATKKRIEQENKKLNSIRDPTPTHLSALSRYLDRVYDEIKLQEVDKRGRLQVVKQLQELISGNEKLANVKLELTGSVRAGFALKDSDTNIRIEAKILTADIFEEIHGCLLTDDERYTDVVLNLETKFPYISFSTPTATGVFSLRVIDEGKHHTHIVLSAYSQWHPKVRQLGTLLKHCAKQGDVTNVERGGLLPLCMPILVIYYCQQKNLLPVLLKADDVAESTNEVIQSLVDQCLVGGGTSGDILNQAGCATSRIWLEVLRFYSLQFDKEQYCVSILQKIRQNKDVKSWPRGKRLAIEEPGLPKRNLSLGLSNQLVMDYIHDYFRSCYMQFALPTLQPPEEGMTPEDSFVFSFSALASFSKNFPIFCRDCHEAGHMASECPPVELPECEELEGLTDNQRNYLRKLLSNVKEQNELIEEDEEMRAQLVENLTMLIQEDYPGAQLEVFGSSANGFGSSNSDIDISMVLEGQDSMQQSEMCTVIKHIERLLRERRGEYDDILTITDCKVPIVKFTVNGIECDLSLYNRLALQNTRMLHRYSQIDERVRTLGYCIKTFAKECEMADAYQRTLSSYAYILMLIFYLQRCEPPVLPVLQELCDGEDVPEEPVDEWNTWFYKGNNEQLRARWPGYGGNRQDVTELWMGFLDFYSQGFNLLTNVVSIRQTRDVTKREKLWYSDKLVIEDPFNTDKNLGIGLTKKTNTHILSNLIIGRNIFGNPKDSEGTAFNHFFRNEKLLKMPPPPTAQGRR